VAAVIGGPSRGGSGGVFWFGFWVSPVLAQQAPQAGAPVTDISNIPKPVSETLDTVHIRNLPNDVQVGKKITEKDTSCVLPPLTLISGPTIAASQLKITAKARKEYRQACAALKNNKTADAERHLRRALQHYPKYSAAWVTLRVGPDL
jgi:hypothetical protein